MPCNTVSTVEVKLEKANLELMESALKALKLSPYRQGTALMFGQGEFIDTQSGIARLSPMRNPAEIKRAYSAEVVKSQARKYGWTLKETAPFQYEVTKR